jgi:hypothetical protein
MSSHLIFFEQCYGFRLHLSGAGMLSSMVARQLLADEMSDRSKLCRKPEGNRGTHGFHQSESRVQIIRYRSSARGAARIIGLSAWPNAPVLGAKTPQGLLRNKRRQKIRLSLGRKQNSRSLGPKMRNTGTGPRYRKATRGQLDAHGKTGGLRPILGMTGQLIAAGGEASLIVSAFPLDVQQAVH